MTELFRKHFNLEHRAIQFVQNAVMQHLSPSRAIISCMLCLGLPGCHSSPPPLPAWNAGKLIIAVPESIQGAEAEFERELARLLGEFMHTQVELRSLPAGTLLSTLQTHQVHLAAASLRSNSSISPLHFGSIYQTVRERLICNSDHPLPKTLVDLPANNLAAIAGSAQEEALREAQKDQPTLQWQPRSQASTMQLLEEVSEGKLECAVANELQFFDARNYYPNLTAVLDIAPPSKLAWGFPGDVDRAFLQQVEKFFEHIQKDRTLYRLLDRYYGHHNRLDKVDAAAYIHAAQTVLPHYKNMFQEAATITGEDWRLLAALAYQESQWDPFATSFTNVRGMMMLTEDTADRMNLDNRLDARENIIAGAKYLVLLKAGIPDRIQEPDRTWLALAAYNQGFGHMEDARILTSRAKLNPDSWSDVKKWMPRLNQPEFYESLKHGYARGGEAVTLVENIRSYFEILKRLEPEHLSLSDRLGKPWHRWLHHHTKR